MRAIDADELWHELGILYEHNKGHVNWNDAILEIKNAPTIEPEQQWIPVSERLPEECQEVFVYLFDRPSPYIAWIEFNRWRTDEFELEKEHYPSAWMPLPKPYKEEKNEHNV